MSFNKIDIKKRENYRLKYLPYMKGFLKSTFYDENYSIDFPLRDKTFRNDALEIIGQGDWNSVFLEGAREIQYKKNSKIAITKTQLKLFKTVANH